MNLINEETGRVHSKFNQTVTELEGSAALSQICKITAKLKKEER